MATQKEQDILKKFTDEGFGLSQQALGILTKLDSWEENCTKIINIAKERKFIIAGGDILRFIVRGDLPTAIVTAEDVPDMPLGSE